MAEQAKSVMAVAGHDSYEMTRFNAVKHAILSRYTVLPWEDESEYGELLDALVGEHKPQGPTEEHLVEELAGILWRKRRLRLAEAAAYRRGLEDTLEPYRETVKAALVHLDATDQSEGVVDAIRATADETAEDIREMEEDQAMTRRALDLLDSSRNDVYEAALAALRDDTREWWEDVLARDPDEPDEDEEPATADPDELDEDEEPATADADELDEDEEPATADAEGLRRFLEGEVMPWFETRLKELANRPLIREQVFGEALDADKLERLGRYEVHLDRKLERTLTMLIRLQDLRRTAKAD